MARRKKTDEEPKENPDNLNNNSDDTFGLPEVEYEPLKRDQTEPPAEIPSEPVAEEPVANTTEEPVYEKPYETVEETQPSSHYQEETVHNQEELHHDYSQHYSYREPESPMWPKVLAIVLLLLVAGGAVYYFGFYNGDQKDIAARELAREAAAKAAEERRRAEAAEKARAAAEQRRLDSLASIPKVGTFEILSQRTGQYYVVVASAIDDDLLTDYANKLVSQGKSVKLIPPSGRKGKFYRLAVEAKDSYADAQATADGMKGGDFGDQLWVVKY